VAARRRAGLTQQDLADMLDVNKSTVYRWEIGVADVQARRRPMLAKALGVSRQDLENLLGRTPPSGPDRPQPPARWMPGSAWPIDPRLLGR
jgi:transcriptional regulator with XRE-family HTH domain